MYVKFYFLLEDWSGKELIRALMEKLLETGREFEYDFKSFRGCGDLLKHLPGYLKGFNKALKPPNDETSYPLFIVLDNDARDTVRFQSELEKISDDNGITIDHVFCIAVEEMEAWLLGDLSAVEAAYRNAKKSVLRGYRQDSVCGTWELLADAIYPGGSKKLKGEGYPRIGKCKSEWAQNIGPLINLQENKSPTFQAFLREIEKRLPEKEAGT